MRQTVVTVGSESRTCATADALRIAGEMGASPDNLPTFRQLAEDATGLRSDGGEISAEGLARSSADRTAAEAQGYTTKGTIVARGQEVNATGVDNAREKRAEWEALPLTSDGCADVIAKVRAEDRRDTRAAYTGTLRMNEQGLLVTPEGDNGKRYSLTHRAFRGLVARLGCGGADYLERACSDKLRAINVNHQATALEARERSTREAFIKAEAVRGYRASDPPDYSSTVIRTRKLMAKGAEVTGIREAFAVVSPSYAPFDADKVADIVRAGIGPECRGAVSYDGQRSRFEALIHSTVQPENYVAGEFFRAGIVCDSDDTGAGGIRIRGVVFQNLCLNLIVLDEAWQDFGSVVHKGSPRRMVSAVRDALRAAVASLEHFREAWGYASQAPVLTEEQIALGREIAMLGLFRGILNRELVKVPGKVEENAGKLLTLWEGDNSSAKAVTPYSKASVVNAFTALAHTEDLDVWQADDLSAQATRLLLRKQPLPFELIEA